MKCSKLLKEQSKIDLRNPTKTQPKQIPLNLLTLIPTLLPLLTPALPLLQVIDVVHQSSKTTVAAISQLLQVNQLVVLILKILLSVAVIQKPLLVQVLTVVKTK